MIKFPNIEEGEGPVLMLNMLKFRDKRIYFEKYVPAFNRVIKQLGIEGVKVALVTEVLGNIVAAEGEVWDAIAMVEYPSAEAFKSMALSEEYRTIAGPLREAALEDLKLIMTRRTDF